MTLIDAWGPANTRASSGGETRVIRAAYGTRAVYTAMTLRARDLWRAFDPARRLLHENGVLWLFGKDDAFARASAEVLRGHGASFEPLSLAEAARRFPQIEFAGVRSVYLEEEAGFVFARRACEEVVRRFVDEGGAYRRAAAVAPLHVGSGPLERLPLEDGDTLDADTFVFACGPWLPALFPDVVGRSIVTPRQEVLYFGTPPGDERFTAGALPVWMDFAAGSRAGQIYGIPAADASGFKVADDAPGPPLDPTHGDRSVDPGSIARARAFLALRFPALAGAPLVAAEVCQYETTPDAHFLLDRHPRAANLWIAGGGSGHGFKMGPAVGELVSSVVLDGGAFDPRFALSRLAAAPAGGWQGRW